MASFPSSSAITSLPSSSPSKKHTVSSHSLSPRRSKGLIASLKIGVEEIAELAQNKALVAATIASAIGQLSKPFTSAIRGDGIDLKAVIRSGGMPSTHSAGVVAAATSLGLERGLSDSIFGMSVIFAAIVMYDAQGVRREVGNHAKILNRLHKAQGKRTLYLEEDALVDSKRLSSINSEEIAPVLSLSEKSNSLKSNSDSYSFLSSKVTPNNLGSMPNLRVDVKETSEPNYSNYEPLNELVGHTEIQVLVGACLGFIVSLAIDTIL